MEPGEALEAVVAARDLAFEPDVIRAPAGAELTVLLTNAGREPHDIAFMLDTGEPIDPGAVSPIIEAGESTKITFTTPGPGRYQFVCQVHPLEMTGNLRIGGVRPEADPQPVVRPNPFPLADDPRIDPSDFRVTTFAWGLPYTNGMLALPDGSLLVAVNEGDGTAFVGSTGKLLRMSDDDSDGVADAMSPVGIVAPAGGHGPLVLRELPGAIVQMRAVGDIVVVTTRQPARSHLIVLRAGPPGEHLRLLGRMTLDYAREHVHRTYGIAVREAQAPGSVEVYFNIGSRLDDASDLAPVGLAGLATGALRPESIHRVTLAIDGDRVTASEPELVATGLRNAAGMAFHPESGDLYLQDNGMNLDDGSEDQLSADELNVIPTERLGREVLDFGFPSDYVAAGTGARVGGGAEQPVLAFLPTGDGQAEGAAEITFAPPGFPAGLDTGLFVGFHGRYSLGGVANEENPVLYVDLAERVTVPFVPNDAPDVGHLDSLLSTSDSLFLADINRLGPMGSTAPQGVIYQVKALDEDR